MIAVEFARQFDKSIHRLQIALHHHRARHDHRFADPGDLDLDEAGRRIDLAALSPRAPTSARLFFFSRAPVASPPRPYAPTVAPASTPPKTAAFRPPSP